jgi:hypothetical protein
LLESHGEPIKFWLGSKTRPSSSSSSSKSKWPPNV